MMPLLIVILLAFITENVPVLCAQKAVTSVPPSRPNEAYEAVDPTVVDSKGCVDDVIRMRLLSGVAQRKLLADLIQTSCLRKLQGIYYVGVEGQPYKGLTLAHLIIDDRAMKVLAPKQLDGHYDAITTGERGFVDTVYIELSKCVPKAPFDAEVKKKLEQRLKELEEQSKECVICPKP
jgi:hypothetical protein